MSDQEPKLVLVGVPGSGKSTIAHELGKARGWPVLDTDQMVAEAAHTSPEDAFVVLGETRFRQYEARAAQTALESPAIVALGSGAVENQRIREMLCALNCPRLWLQVSLAAVVPRIGLNKPHPVALGLPRALWKELENQRRLLYQEVSTHSFDTSDTDAAGAAQEILHLLSNLTG